MYEREQAIENMILKVRIGSHLYGTNTPESDEDFLGVFIPDHEYLIGLKTIEEVDAGIVDKNEEGKNTEDAVDFKLHTLARFARLALDNNPNILEILFVNIENIVFATDLGYELLARKKSFLSKNLKHRFLGYAFSQKHKMVIKLDNYEKLQEALEYLKHCIRNYMVEVIEIDHNPLFVRKKDHISVGDINIPVSCAVKKAITMVEGRLAQFGSRQELVSKYGYDTKFASHLIRLIVEGVELLETGDLIFPLRDVQLLRDIRSGVYEMPEVLEMAERYEKQIEGLYESSTVPAHADFETINKFVMETHRRFICG